LGYKSSIVNSSFFIRGNITYSENKIRTLV
jgi:hypothetical protein